MMPLKIKYVESILDEMADSRDDAISSYERKRKAIFKHVLLLCVYGKNSFYASDWEEELANYFNDVDSITTKPKNKKLEASVISRSLFTSMVDNVAEAKMRAKAFKDKYFGNDKQYTLDFKVTDDLAERILKLYIELDGKITSMEASKSEYDLNDYKKVVHEVVHKVLN